MDPYPHPATSRSSVDSTHQYPNEHSSSAFVPSSCTSFEIHSNYNSTYLKDLWSHSSTISQSNSVSPLMSPSTQQSDNEFFFGQKIWNNQASFESYPAQAWQARNCQGTEEKDMIKSECVAELFPRQIYYGDGQELWDV